MTFATYVDAAPSSRAVEDDAQHGRRREMVLPNHLAFSVDVRFYQTRPEVQTRVVPGPAAHAPARAVGGNWDPVTLAGS